MSAPEALTAIIGKTFKLVKGSSSENRPLIFFASVNNVGGY